MASHQIALTSSSSGQSKESRFLRSKNTRPFCLPLSKTLGMQMKKTRNAKFIIFIVLSMLISFIFILAGMASKEPENNSMFSILYSYSMFIYGFIGIVSSIGVLLPDPINNKKAPKVMLYVGIICLLEFLIGSVEIGFDIVLTILVSLFGSLSWYLVNQVNKIKCLTRNSN